jgi:hypothetical protein
VDIAVLERKFSFRSKYDISAGADNCCAEKKRFSFLAKLEVLGENRQLSANIRERFSPFRLRYEFLFAGGTIYRFWCEKAWKRIFQREGDQKSYRRANS